MTKPLSIMAFIAAATCSVPVATAQDPATLTLAVGAGFVFADKGPSDYLDGQGFGAFVRGGFRPRGPVSAILDAWIQRVPRPPDLVDDCTPCPRRIFEGPTTVLTVAPAIEGGDHRKARSFLVRVGPSVHWFLDRARESDALALGLRAGFSLPMEVGRSRLLVSADYMRAFRHRELPGWLIPITFGWQF